MGLREGADAGFGGARLVGLLGALAAIAGLAACAGTTPRKAAVGVRSSAASKAGGATAGSYKLGAPYQAAGLWYVPADEPDYDQVGVASWYGDQFDGQPTANGERFDMHSASAAHTTLPMPSIVEVTNLENGRSLRVRLNDRGPFKAGRIIDLSRAGARELGFLEKGTAKVRVRYIGPARLDGSLEPLFVAARAKGNLQPVLRQGPVIATPMIPAQDAVLSVSVTSSPYSPSIPPSPAPPPWRAPEARQGGYAVQAGAFADRARAERAAETLSAAGAAAIHPVEVASRQLYRVVVGPWREERQALAARAQVASLGFAEARVVKAF